LTLSWTKEMHFVFRQHAWCSASSSGWCQLPRTCIQQELMMKTLTSRLQRFQKTQIRQQRIAIIVYGLSVMPKHRNDRKTCRTIYGSYSKITAAKTTIFSGGFPASCILPEVLEKFLARRLNSMAWGLLIISMLWWNRLRWYQHVLIKDALLVNGSDVWLIR